MKNVQRFAGWGTLAIGLCGGMGFAWAQGDGLDPLSALAALGSEMAADGPDAGGSIRAKKTADIEVLKRKRDKRNLEAKVEMVKKGRFPLVAVKLKVIKPAKEGWGKDLGRNESIVVVPALKVDQGDVVLADPNTLLNAGTFYLQAGDKVMVRVGAKQGGVWPAEYIERK